MNSSFSRIIGFGAACVALYIGAGYATMQEIMQFQASYGSLFFVVVIVAALIYIYTSWSFTINGSRERLTRGGDIYQVYCGKWIGRFYDYFSALFCYLCFIVMCGGANSTAIEQWGMPGGLGATIMAIATVITVYFGLNNMLRVLKWVGPLVVILIIFISLSTTIMNWDHLSTGLQTIDSHRYPIMQVGDGNAIASGASYGGFMILCFATFLAELGAKNKVSEVNLGMLLSSLAIFGTASICNIALIANIDQTWSASIPALLLAEQIHPIFAGFFAIIIYLGIFSSACPFLWTGIRKVSNDGTRRYKILCVAGGAIGLITACLVPYKGVLNAIYGINGYLGFALVVFMIAKDLKTFLLKR